MNAATPLAAFQDAFAKSLFAPEHAAHPLVSSIAQQPAFAVYRNTVLKGCVDALEANFPAVLRLVGADWFRSATLDFVRLHPPVDARLLAYGDGAFASLTPLVKVP